MTDMFDEMMVYEDLYGMRFIVLSTRSFQLYPWEQHYIPLRRLETYMREARVHDYQILINPHLDEYYGNALLIDPSLANLVNVVAEYNYERRFYDLF